MEKYSKYKDSGVKWIGDVIPAHWEIVELKRLATFNPPRREELDKETLVGYAPMDRVRSDMLAPLAIQMKNLSTGLTYFEEGDVVMAKVTPCFENGNVAIVPKMVHYCGYGSSELFVYRCNEEKLKSRLLLYYMLSAGFVSAGISSMTGTGGLKRVSPTFARNVRIPLPPLTEQRAIVSYLDGKVGQIDTYIAKQTQQIELLKELKQAVIANAVTKGIANDSNHHTKLKQSGISWIGEIPEHWEVKKLRHLINIISIKNHPNETLLSVVREQGVIVRDLETDDNHNYIPEDLSGYKLIKEGQFVINKMKAWQGSYAVSSYRGIVSPAYYTCDLRLAYKDFFNIAIRSRAYVPFFTQYSKGIRVGQWDLSPIGLKEIPFFLPPLSEQRAIVSFIEAKTASINKLINAYEQQVERVKEYKQRLISDAVTGKMNVTDEQTQTN